MPLKTIKNFNFAHTNPMQRIGTIKHFGNAPLRASPCAGNILERNTQCTLHAKTHICV